MVVLPLPYRYLLLVLQNRVLDRFVDLLRSKHETLRQEDVEKLQFGHFLGAARRSRYHPKWTKKKKMLDPVT